MQNPQVTAILPAKDSAPFIGTTLETLKRKLDDPATVKLVAIDDGSSDGTGDIMRAYAERFAHAEVLSNPSPRGTRYGAEPGTRARRGRRVLLHRRR